MRLLVFALLTCVSCGAEVSEPPMDGGADARIEAVRALCRARDASARNMSQARAIFFDAAHDPLHDIAGSVTDEDPGIAARLLEAKQQIESDLEESAPKDVEPHFETLIEASNQALGRLGLQEVSCP